MPKGLGFKKTGKGPSYGSFKFPSSAGFSHSGTSKQNVKGYTRSAPKQKYAHGGMVTAPMATGDSSVIKRAKPVTGFDAEHGGKGPLRPGFNKGGKACYAEGGKVGSVKKVMHQVFDKHTGKNIGKPMDDAEKAKKARDKLDQKSGTYSHGFKEVPPKYAEGGKVATTGAAIKMMKELMKRGNSAEDAASKAARRYGVSPAQVKAPTGPTGGGGLPAEKQMLARGGMAKMVGRTVGRAAQSFVPSPQGQKAPGRMTNHGYGSFGRRPIVR